jgi:hypothetical protein
MDRRNANPRLDIVTGRIDKALINAAPAGDLRFHGLYRVPWTIKSTITHFRGRRERLFPLLSSRAIRTLTLRPILVLPRPPSRGDACIKHQLCISNDFLGGAGT